MKHTFELGEFVRLIVPHSVDLDISNDQARGRVVQRLTKEDFGGSKQLVVGVRWFGSNGEPDSEIVHHSPSELEALS